MAATVGLQITRHHGPCHAKTGASQHHQRQHDPSRQKCREPQRNQARAQATQNGLPLATNVEQPAVKRHGNGQTGEHKRGCVVQRVTQATGRTKGTLHQSGNNLRRVLPDHRHHRTGSQQGHAQAHRR